jgi:penicillin-binding protein 1A
MAGGAIAVPIFTDFMEIALKDQPAVPFRIPPGVRLVTVNARTGALSNSSDPMAIQEAFRPGTEPGVSFNGFDDNCMSISGSCGDTGFGSTVSQPGDTAAPPADVPGDVAETELGDVY